MAEIRLLGIAQDAGVPQAGCNCAACRRAREDHARRELTVSLGLIDRSARLYWIIDATPDFKDQWGQLLEIAPDCRLGGILLTHLHMGHYTGLLHLGEEAANLRSVPLYCTQLVGKFLTRNAPWSGLIERGNLEIKKISSEAPLNLSGHLKVSAYEIPHRSAEAETLAFGIYGRNRQMFYCPDIDVWSKWDRDLRHFITAFDIALLDGTFFASGEVPGRDIRDIPHPTVIDTMRILEGVEREIVFIHLNHTNPLLVSEKVRELVLTRGFQIGFEGQTWDLD